MADTNYPIPEYPVYNPNIRALQDSDPARASTIFNPLFEQIIENVHAVKQEADEVKAQATAALAAEEYNPESTYGKGDYCTKDGKLYKANQDITIAEAWTEDHWTVTEVSAELTSIWAALSNKADRQLSNLDTPQLALANLGAGVRPNLLDNAYFVGGGSQQGEEQLPINQIGATSWNTAGNVFDRWKISLLPSYPVGTLDLEPDGAYLSNTTGTSLYFNQIVPDAVSKRLAGKTVTLSFLTTELSGNWGIGEYAQESAVFSSSGLLSITFAWNDSVAVKRVQMWSIFNNPGTAKVVAAKLEEGEGQTLAYKDSTGAWKLLPQPDMDYGMQLEKCREYFRRFNAEFSFLGTGYAISESTAIVFIPLTRPMRLAAPTATLKGTVYLWENGNTAGSSFPSIELVSGSASIGNENTLAQVQFKTSGLTPGLPVAAQIRDTSSYFDIDANL